MLARLLRSRQHSGQSLSFCGEAHFDKTWRRSSVNKLNYLGSLHHWISESKPAAAGFAWVCRLASHWVTVDGLITMLKWTWHCRRPQNRTENFVRFKAGRTEHSDGFSERCAIIFRLSHPAAARFRRSFRNSVCKTSLMPWRTKFQTSSPNVLGFISHQHHPLPHNTTMYYDEAHTNSWTHVMHVNLKHASRVYCMEWR